MTDNTATDATPNTVPLTQFKHFKPHHGGHAENEMIRKQAEEFVNREDIDPISIDHSYTGHPSPCLSIFVIYVDIVKAKKIIIEAVENTEKKTKVKKNPKKKK